jgi:hypothetical protein
MVAVDPELPDPVDIMSSRILNVAILLATIGSAAVSVRWADREFRRVEPPTETARPVPRPEWFWALNRPYRRLQFDWTWVCVAATVGMGAVVARDPRPRRRPGAIVVIVALLVGVVSAAHYLVTAPAIFRTHGDCYGLHNALQVRVPGAILGAWALTWGRKAEWRGRLIGWMWMVQVGMLVAYGILFG